MDYKTKILKPTLKVLLVVAAFITYSTLFAIFSYVFFNTKETFNNYILEFFKFYLYFLWVTLLSSSLVFLVIMVFKKIYHKLFN